MAPPKKNKGKRAGSTSKSSKGFGVGGVSNENKSNGPVQSSPFSSPSPPTPSRSVSSDSDRLVQSLTQSAPQSILGRAVSPSNGQPIDDPFYELIPLLIQSKFPSVPDSQLTRVAGFLSHATDPTLPLEDSIINDPHRPHHEIHAYMPGLGDDRPPFYDPDELELCHQLQQHYPTIRNEYRNLIDSEQAKHRFQSVTSMNYESGWTTLVLFYNGHRIDDFPYHLCPVTTQIMERVPLAGRIAGFNRQCPKTGIPKHTDGNNMWLTCQMGITVPKEQKAYIRVGPETRYWSEGQCLVYDTTFEHETMNESENEERVVLHIDFFNTLAMTQIEIQIMQYIYQMREAFMKAEGVAKVGAQIL